MFSSTTKQHDSSYVSTLEEELRNLRLQLAASEEARRCLESQTRTGELATESILEGPDMTDAEPEVAVVVSSVTCGSVFEMSDGDGDECADNNDLEELFEFRGIESPKEGLAFKGTTFLMDCSKDSRHQAQGNVDQSRKVMKLFKLPVRFKRGSSKKKGSTDSILSAPHL